MVSAWQDVQLLFQPEQQNLGTLELCGHFQGMVYSYVLRLEDILDGDYEAET